MRVFSSTRDSSAVFRVSLAPLRASRASAALFSARAATISAAFAFPAASETVCARAFASSRETSPVLGSAWVCTLSSSEALERSSAVFFAVAAVAAALSAAACASAVLASACSSSPFRVSMRSVLLVYATRADSYSAVAAVSFAS